MTDLIVQNTGLQNLPEFQWRTMEGQVLTIRQMETKHIFNSMKMLFNHLAEELGGEPVWFVQVYDDYVDRAQDPDEQKWMAFLVCVFVEEIERRGDLPVKYSAPYQQILTQITGLPQLAKAHLLLTEGVAA